MGGKIFFKKENYPWQKNSSVSGTSGDDSIYNSGDEGILPGGDNVTISAGAGNDYISNYRGSNATLGGGKGNDTLKVSGDEIILFGTGDGSDIILNYQSQNSISLTSGSINDTLVSGSNIILSLGKDSLTLKDAKNKYILIKNVDGSETVINADRLPKTISNEKNKKKITTGAGDDSILTYYGDSVKIDAGAGNDSIYNEDGNNISISAGSGNDYIVNDGGENFFVTVSGVRNTVKGTATVNLGTGNSTLSGDNAAQVFQYVGGQNVITNYSYEDTIHITSGKIDSYSFDGGDLIFHIGDGSLRLRNMTNHAITVKDSSGETTTQTYSNGYSPQQVIKNLVAAWQRTIMSGTAKLNEAVAYCSQFKNIHEAIDKMVADCRKVNDAETFLRDYCGIILGNKDTGAITGWDAGGASVKTAHGVINETLSTLQHVPDYTDTTFKTVQGVTINLSSTGDSLTADGKKVFDGLYSWWADESLDLIEKSYGVKFGEDNTINFSLVPSSERYWGITNGSNVRIDIGDTTFDSADDYNGNGVDRAIAHEFTHVAQNLFMGSFPQFLEEGLAELTCGIDDRRTGDMEDLAGNANNLAAYLDVDNYGTGQSYYYAAGYMFLRYLAKQASDSYDATKNYAWQKNSSVSGTSGDDYLTGNAKAVTISAGKGNDTLTAYYKNMKLFGGAGNDDIIISSLGSGAIADGGTGNDYIENEGKNVTISAGAGNDSISLTSYASLNVIEYAAGDGNDKIFSFDDDDTLQIGGGTGTYSSKKSGDNLIVTVGDGKITLVGGADLYELHIDGTKVLTVTNSTKSPVTLDSKVKIVDASARTKSVQITGNKLANSIVGGAKNDTLFGGAGNDTLFGGDGSDIFIYKPNEGTDYIMDFTGSDMLKILNADGSQGTFTNSSFKNGNLTLAISGGGHVQFKDISAGDTFNINGTVHSIVGKKLK